MTGVFSQARYKPANSLELEKVTNQIEQDLYDCSEPEVKSSKIGELVMDHLAALNEVAYVRFASVYRRFKDIASFEKELHNIRQQRQTIGS